MSHVFRCGWILLAVVALPTGARADVVELKNGAVRVVVEAPHIKGKHITLGLTDSIRITYHVAGSAGQKIKLEPWANPKEVWKARESPPVTGRDWEQTVTVEPWKPGKFSLFVPAVVVGEVAPVTWDDLSVQVETRVKLEDPLRPVPDLEAVPPVVTAANPLWWLLGVVPVVIFAGLLWLFLRGRLRRPVREDFLTRSLAELARLEAANPASHGEMEACYGQLSHILRDFTEKHLAVSGKAKTSAEWLAAVFEKDSLPEPARGFLRDFLAACDRIRFAPILPSLDDYRATVARVRWFVREEWKPATDKIVSGAPAPI